MALELPNEALFQPLYQRWQKYPHTTIIRDLANNKEADVEEFLHDILALKQRIFNSLNDQARKNLQVFNGDDVYVAVMVEPGYAFVTLLMALYALGAVIVPLSPHILPEEGKYFLELCKADLLLTIPPLNDHAQTISNLSGTSIFTYTSLSLTPSPTFTLQPEYFPKINPQRGLVLLYTSGTTGPPKGVLHTRYGSEPGFLARAQKTPVEVRDAYLHHAPGHWAGGFQASLGTLFTGGCVEFCRAQFNLDWLIQRILTKDQQPVESVFFTPPLLDRLVDRITKLQKSSPEESDRIIQAIRALKTVGVGGMRTNPATMHFFMDIGCPVLSLYACTEMMSIIASTQSEAHVPNCVGKVTPGVDLKISDDGEICVKSQRAFKHYLSPKPDIMKDVFDSDGYYRTGDVGKLEDGLLYVLGRASQDVIRFSGWKVHAPEVEICLIRHPSISSAIVVGVSDLKAGQRVAALVVRQGSMCKELSLSHVRQFLVEQGLSAYKLPSLLRVVSDDSGIPVTVSGKPRKNDVRDEFFKEEDMGKSVEVWDLSIKMADARPFDWAGIQDE